MRRQLRHRQRWGGKEALASMWYVAQANRNWQDSVGNLAKSGNARILDNLSR